MIEREIFGAAPFRADIQTTHMRRRNARQLRIATENAPTVVLDRLVNERVAILEDGRRVNLRFLDRAEARLRPSRTQVRQTSEVLRGRSGRLILMRSAGTGIQADIAYQLDVATVPGGFGDAQRQTLASVANIYLSLGMILAGFGLATVRSDQGADALLTGHLFLLNGAQTDAREAGIGIWANRQSAIPALDVMFRPAQSPTPPAIGLQPVLQPTGLETV